LRERVASASYARVLITAPDRLARHYVLQWLLIEEFEQAGCQVEFLDRPMSHDPHDQLLLQIRGAVAEYERTLITERLRRGRHQKYRAGTLLPWTTPPFGYRSTPDRPRDPSSVWVEPAEAAVVTELFAAYLEEGASVASVAKRLSRWGIPSPTGLRYWSRATVARILGNPVYPGQVYAGQGRARPIGPSQSALRPPGKRLRGSAPTPREEWIFVGQDVGEVLTHPQILALERVQAGNWLSHELQARRANLRTATSHLTQQIERLTEAYLGQVVGLEEYGRRRRELEERLARLAEQQRELEASLAHRRDLASSIEHITEFCQRVQAGLAQATFEQKRQLLHLLIDSIVVRDEEVEIRYVIPLSARSEHTCFYQLRLTYLERLHLTVGEEYRGDVRC
jgi:DNA invertase Pin-like site-specific DNA recombinase